MLTGISSDNYQAKWNCAETYVRLSSLAAELSG
jgi:hypothetical protein